MYIIIPIKQVPETSNVKMDPATGTMIRAGVEAIINPLDLYAIEAALRLRNEHGGKVTVISMGPLKAEKALREALGMGCDEGVLISHRAFSGSDTWATSYTLAQSIRKLGVFDLIICGERATDGDTGQVGPGIASFLDLPLATYVSRLQDVTSQDMRVGRMVEGGTEWLKMQLPAVLTVVKDIASPRLPTLRGMQRARLAQIPTWGPEDLEVDTSWIGLNGSPTRVVKIETPQAARHGEILVAKDAATIDYAADRLVAFLKEKRLIPS